MKNIQWLLILLVAALGAACAPQQATDSADSSTGPTESTIALVGGTLIDGTGSDPINDSVVLIRGDRIESVGTTDRLSVPDGYERISTEGMTVMPGLIDPHVHLLYNGHPDTAHWFDTYDDQFAEVTIPASVEQILLAGVTSVRDLGVPADDIFEVRRRVNAGEIPGPTIYTAGPLIMPGDTPLRVHTLAVSGVDDAREQTQGLIDAGVDIIKVFNAQQMPAEDFAAIVQTAHSADLMVTAHGRSDDEIRAGLAAGVDEFQHIGGGSTEYPADIVETIRERVASGPPLYWSPTVGPQLNADELAADHDFLNDARNYVGLPDAIAGDVGAAVAEAQFNPGSPETASTVERKIAQLRELGVVLIAGSDMGVFGVPASYSISRDLEAWVRELGMEPMDAILWATVDAAEALGVRADYGTVTPAKFADVIAVAGDPLEDITVLRDPTLVIRHGTRYK
jgi:imidazolonepropionase-like amidohydrolase